MYANRWYSYTLKKFDYMRPTSQLEGEGGWNGTLGANGSLWEEKVWEGGGWFPTIFPVRDDRYPLFKLAHEARVDIELRPGDLVSGQGR